MSSALSSSTALPRFESQPIAHAVGSVFAEFTSANTEAYETLKARIEEKLPREASRRHYLLLGAFAVLLHGAAVIGYVNRSQTSTLRQPPHQVEIEFIKPVIEPPKEIEPPKPPPPPPPKVVRQPPPPAPTPGLRTAPAEENIAPNDITVQENTDAPKSTGPVVAAPPEPPPPAPKVEEPVTEATGNAAYLNNPPPEYPAFAQRQGWEGTVLLRVHVLASGRPDKVEIKQSSGRKTLDDSALTAVKNWTFVPSKRGSKPIDGWATVPIEFKLAK